MESKVDPRLTYALLLSNRLFSAIKAKVVSKATAGELKYDITYDIKLTKILKGPIRHYDTICTASSSAACGVTLNKGVEYFITGQLKPDGSLRVSSCNYVVPWMSSHDILVEHFMMGCDCKITRCSSVPCGIGSPTECLWTNTIDEQDKQSACIKKSDGSCSWYREEPNGH
ncbi:metalloproteinase inhibitor 2-like [Nerophis lumbriciformis]|uniref:metalloproteinase inhibitor 2-like n=1 Tax=Nerophis lumbriciformis TaxID=546530 RepID=UPI002ADFE80F|nr:metalloproteinase inhibitor 2-like [Nerophis lumbriciformis]